MTTSTRTKSKSKKQSSSAGIWIILGAALLLALVVLLLWLNNRSTAVALTQPEVPAEWISGKSLGDPNAPVVVQMWEDFLCPACQQFANTVKPQLIEDFVKAGTVRLEFHQFPLDQHAPGAQMAANASECAADQNLFWPYHDRVFVAAQQRGQAGVVYDQLVTYAGEAGLDTEQFRSCMNSLQFNEAVAASLTEAQQLGLNSTPSILVNGVLAPEPFNYNALTAQIEAASAN
jgi:protein-disulfide isomerase